MGLVTNCQSKQMKCLYVLTQLANDDGNSSWPDALEVYQGHFKESVTDVTMWHSKKLYFRFEPLIKRFVAFIFYTNASVEEALEFYKGTVTLPPYWFGQRDMVLGLLCVAKEFVSVNMEFFGRRTLRTLLDGRTCDGIPAWTCRLNGHDRRRWDSRRRQIAA